MPTYNGARAQRDLMDRAAVIQQQRDAQAAEQQAKAAEEASRHQQNLMGTQFGYQQAGAAQQAGFQQQRDAQQFGYQSAGMDQQAAIQKQRDELLIKNQQTRDAAQQQHEGMMQEAGIQGQMRVFNNQLSSGETLRLQRLREQLNSVNEAVSNGTLSPRDAGEVRMQLQSGIDPLMRRQVQSQIDAHQAQTQAIQANTTMQAHEFNRRQNILAMTAQDRMQTVYDPHTNTYGLQQLMPDGSMAPVNFGQMAQQHLAHMYTTASNLMTADQQRQHAAQMNPLTIQAAQQNLEYLRGLHPLELEHLRQRVARGPQAFANEDEMHAARIGLMRFDEERGRAMLPGQVQHQNLANTGLGLANTHTGLTNTALQQSIDDHPAIRDLRNQQTQGLLAMNDVQIAHQALLNQQLSRNLANGITPQAHQRITEHQTTALRREMADQRNPNRFQYTAPPNSSETAEQRTARERREFNAEVTRRTNEITGGSRTTTDQGTWNTIEGVNRTAVNNLVRTGGLRIPAGVNRDDFINQEVERRTAAHLGLPAAEPFYVNPVSGIQRPANAPPLTAAQQTVQDHFTAMQESALALPAGDGRERARTLLGEMRTLVGRYGRLEAMPPTQRSRLNTILAELTNLGVRIPQGNQGEQGNASAQGGQRNVAQPAQPAQPFNPHGPGGGVIGGGGGGAPPIFVAPQ